MRVDATVERYTDMTRLFRIDDLSWSNGQWGRLLTDLDALPCDYACELCRDTIPPEPAESPNGYKLDEALYWWVWIEDPALAFEFKMRWT